MVAYELYPVAAWHDDVEQRWQRRVEGDAMKTEPLRTVFWPLALAAFATAGQAFLDGATTRGVVTAALGAVVLAAQEWARAQVTPVKRRRPFRAEDGQSEPLTLLIYALVAVILVLLIVYLARRIT